MYYRSLSELLAAPFKWMSGLTERKLGSGEIVTGFVGIVISFILMAFFAGVFIFLPSPASLAQKVCALTFLGIMCLGVLASSVMAVVILYPQNQDVRDKSCVRRLEEKNYRANMRRKNKIRRQHHKENPYDSLLRPWYDPAEYVQ